MPLGDAPTTMLLMSSRLVISASPRTSDCSSMRSRYAPPALALFFSSAVISFSSDTWYAISLSLSTWTSYVFSSPPCVFTSTMPGTERSFGATSQSRMLRSSINERPGPVTLN